MSGIDWVSYQAVKYQNRDGWSHRDVLRLSHPIPPTEAHNELFNWIVKGWETVAEEPHPRLPLIWAFEYAKRAKSEHQVISLIHDYNLTREMIPTQFLTEPDVWEALLQKMPLTAMIRNLGNMGKVGLITHNFSDAVKLICARLADQDYLRKSRVHPIAVLAALNTYGSGHGYRGSGEWPVVAPIVDALDAAFYLAFGNVPKMDQNVMLALDVSGSMGMGTIAGVGGITPRVGSAAMALVTANTCNHMFVGFSHHLIPLKISPRQRLDDVCDYVRRIPFGGTDCALPMLYAIQNNIKAVDAFIIYTDSETWAGSVHPVQALDQYRRKFNHPAKLIVVGMVSNGFSVADPNDAGMMDVVGFDTATPQVMADFVSH